MSDPAIERILQDEGGTVNDPADKGGPTKYGITVSTLSGFRGRECTAADVAALTRDDAIAIYDAKYVSGPGFDRITDAVLRTAAADAAVLFGPDRVIGALQSLCGVKPDGIFGPVTAAAVNKREARELVNRLSLWRIRKHITRAVTDESQIRFLRGWFERAASFVT